MIEEYQRALATMGASGSDTIDYVFKLCVVLLVDAAEFLGISYEEINVWLFVVILPCILIYQTLRILYLKRKIRKAAD
ncbi:MAG: hypothetical protein P8L68_05150 [Paracoccaceae bacterium]|nr:hypothetical protein [Paracoccaceae bacterium]MDG2257863.1 hypothetical protein [Paracoccaceae bacterium]